MQKKVLAVYYSQSGQLAEIIGNITRPLTAAGHEVETLHIKPAEDYAFPWTGERFYDVMPDAVLGVATELQPFTLRHTQYDLVIVGYQSWFLAPSIPSRSILEHPVIKAVLKNTPVITVTGARNMWMNAFLGIKDLLKAAGAKHVGNIVLVDRHFNHISYFTIFHWLLGGKKTRKWGLFPYPGVSAADIAGAAKFGEVVLGYLAPGNWEQLQRALEEKGAIPFSYAIMILEAKARPQYIGWANRVNSSSNRKRVLSVFKYYLHIALFIGAPVLLTTDAIFIRPFSAKRIQKLKNQYLALQ